MNPDRVGSGTSPHLPGPPPAPSSCTPPPRPGGRWVRGGKSRGGEWGYQPGARSEIVLAPPTVGGPQILPPTDDQILCRDVGDLVVSLTETKTPDPTARALGCSLQRCSLKTAGCKLKLKAARLQGCKVGGVVSAGLPTGRGGVCFREAGICTWLLYGGGPASKSRPWRWRRWRRRWRRRRCWLSRRWLAEAHKPGWVPVPDLWFRRNFDWTPFPDRRE